jgi:GntR family transcriptional regulator, arabinose operon transcriptional repressor
MKTPGKGETRKHILVRNYVESRIRSGALTAGDRLPTESQLMSQLDISRTPVRQALAELEQDGWIYRIRGSGSYVKRAVRSSSIDIYAILYSNQRGIEKDIIHGMRRAVAQHSSDNIHLVLKKPGRDTAELIDVIHQLPKPATGGLVVIPIVDTSRPLNRLLGASLRKLADEKFHVVQLDRCVPEYNGHFVTSNHQLGATKMVEYLVSMGHRRIGCLYEHPENSSIRDRLQGVKTALINHSVKVDPAFSLDVPVDQVAGRAPEIISWIEENQITALFCCESELAREMYSVLQKFNIRVPEDMSLCSFDDHAFVDRDGRFLTAVIQKLEDLGHFAIEIILNGLGHQQSGEIKMTLEPDLAVRSSVARVNVGPDVAPGVAPGFVS